MIVINERSLEQTLKAFSSYYHRWRTHLSLGKDAPQGRQIQTLDEGTVIEIQEVGGLHHHYEAGLPDIRSLNSGRRFDRS